MIYLIRHGQTEFNLAGRLQGRLDSPLTDLGVEQARRMGLRLKDLIAGDHPRARVVSSPLGRTRRTAEIVCDAIGLDCRIELEPRLAEIDVGDWEGLDRAGIQRAAPHVDFQPGWLFQAPGGEREADLEARLGAWLAEVDEADGLVRVVVSHGVAGRVLRRLYCGAEGEAPPQDAVFRLYKGLSGRVDLGAET